ncbi:hypothetical protein SAY87_018809 [Trapa incisa]|uniref:Uncharacterized protein n=1 Tax=Trapa incisa TaxID=236973 RepID=A0AAN7K4Q7_9MYRT|nr:hypothetical protein SAY87_018809 [Trapa incisa]
MHANYVQQVPSLQGFLQSCHSQPQQHPDFHITSSTFLASTFQITRLSTRNAVPGNPDIRLDPNQAAQTGGTQDVFGIRPRCAVVEAIAKEIFNILVETNANCGQQESTSVYKCNAISELKMLFVYLEARHEYV